MRVHHEAQPALPERDRREGDRIDVESRMAQSKRDAHALADALARHGATPEALAAFGRARALDRRLTIGATDALARLFTVDLGPLAPLRGLALWRQVPMLCDAETGPRV